jgi:hypothetical protein
LVRKIVLAIGGRVEAKSGGSTTLVDVDLPAAWARVDPSLQAARVLIGSSDLAAVFGTMLEALAIGVDVRLLQSAGELVDQLKRGIPDVLMIDTRLPGVLVLQDLLRSGDGPGECALVGLRRASDPEQAPEGLRIDRILTLPLSRDDVIRVLPPIRRTLGPGSPRAP